MRSSRQLKKLHKAWLEWLVADVSVARAWRRKLFGAELGQAFSIDADNYDNVGGHLAEAIEKYQLKYTVRTALPSEAPAWASEDGQVAFEFRAKLFPSLVAYSGNNPDAI